MLKKLIEKLDKTLTLEYVNKYLRSKGIATNERGENTLMFKLYDMNWKLYCENGRFGLRNSFNLGNNIDMISLIRAANKLNTDRWIVKAFIETYTPKDENNLPIGEMYSSIIFSFESFCYSESAFNKMYEFAIYAITDGIEYHKNCYGKFLNEQKTMQTTAPIGFHTEPNQSKEATIAINNQKRPRIGFVQY